MRRSDGGRERKMETVGDPTKTSTCFRDLTFAEKLPPPEKYAA